MKLVLVSVCVLVLCMVRGQSAIQCCNNCCGVSDVGNIRLTEPSQSEYDGAVQICNRAIHNNTANIAWTYLNANRLRNWSSTEATVACRQLGLPHNGIHIYTYIYTKPHV